MLCRPKQITCILTAELRFSKSENAGRPEDVHKDFHVKKQAWRRASTITDVQKILEANFKQWHPLTTAKGALLQKAQGLISVSGRPTHFIQIHKSLEPPKSTIMPSDSSYL